MTIESDTTVPIPYARENHVITQKVKFTIVVETETTRKITRVEADGSTETTVETAVTDKDKVIELLTYKHSAEEDVEHFFEAFEHLRKVLHVQWTDVSQSKTNDATGLFEAMDAMLEGNANQEWMTVLSEQPNRTWEAFKKTVGKFITTTILPEDGYSRQLNYVQERHKPMTLTSASWWARIETICRYLPYFFGSLDDLQSEYPKATWSEWWKWGAPTEAFLKGVILTRVPQAWKDKLDEYDVGHVYRKTKSIKDIVDYYQVLEEKELKQRRKLSKGTRVPAPRQQQYRVNNNTSHGREGSNTQTYYKGNRMDSRPQFSKRPAGLGSHPDRSRDSYQPKAQQYNNNYNRREPTYNRGGQNNSRPPNHNWQPPRQIPSGQRDYSQQYRNRNFQDRKDAAYFNEEQQQVKEQQAIDEWNAEIFGEEEEEAPMENCEDQYYEDEEEEGNYDPDDGSQWG